MSKRKPITAAQLRAAYAPLHRSKVASRRRFAIAYWGARAVAVALGRDPRSPGTYRLASALADRD